MRGRAKLASYLAFAMAVAGFVTIYLAWDGAASFDRGPQQFPYLLSGGMTGIGLIIGAMAIMGIQSARRLSAERARQMAQVNEAMATLTAVVRRHGGVPARQPSPESAGEAGTGRGEPSVVAGRSSFHVATCHLVAARDDLDELSREHAQERGLAPCRLCRP